MKSLYLACLMLGAMIATADADVVRRAVGWCGDPCVVTHNNGGSVFVFAVAGDAIARGGRERLVIDGYCASACMVLADRARPRACITDRARFAFHKTNRGRPIMLNGDLHSWIMSTGGYPSFHGTPREMPNSVAQRFWRQCPPSAQPARVAAARTTSFSDSPAGARHLR